jgi:superfamily II DNA or RNA helicase
MHHLAAKTLSQVLSKFSASRILGVTATPERNDGLEHLLYWLVGPVSFVYKRCPEITGKENNVQIIKKSFKTPNLSLDFVSNISFTGIMKMLSTNKYRNDFLVEEILKLCDTRKKILVTTTFVQHGKWLLNELNLKFQNKCVFLHGGCKQEFILFAKSMECKIVIATYQYMEEGYDDATLDSLVLSLPRSKVQQVIGRCERSHIGKLNPIIIDIVDCFPICQGMFKKRMKFYKERSYQIL